MIHCLPTPPTHTTPPNKGKPSLDKIIMGQNSPPSCCPNKEGNPPRGLDKPNNLSWEKNIICTLELFVIRAHIKLTRPPQTPPHLITTLTPRDFRIYKC